MIHNKLFFCGIFLCAMYNGLLGMEDAAVQTDDNGRDTAVQTNDDFDRSKIVIPDRISFLHDQIIFRRINNSRLNQTHDSLWVLDYAIMLNIQQKQGIFDDLITDFSHIGAHLVFNIDELASKNTTIDIGITVYAAQKIFTQAHHGLSVTIGSFKKDFFKEILFDVLSQISLEIILLLSVSTNYNHCSLPGCQKPLKEGYFPNFTWDHLTLFHCGHIIHREHLAELLKTDDPNQPTGSIQCPECKAKIKFLYSDFILIEPGHIN